MDGAAPKMFEPKVELVAPNPLLACPKGDGVWPKEGEDANSPDGWVLPKGVELAPNAGVDTPPAEEAPNGEEPNTEVADPPKSGVEDTAPNGGVELAPNAGLELAPKAGKELAPKAGVEGAPNAGVEAPPKAGVDVPPKRDEVEDAAVEPNGLDEDMPNGELNAGVEEAPNPVDPNAGGFWPNGLAAALANVDVWPNAGLAPNGLAGVDGKLKPPDV